MRNNKIGVWATIGFTIAISAIALVQRSGAQSAEETTILTFSRAVELPGQSLEAGTYIFELVSSMSGFRVRSCGKRLKSRSAVHISRTPCRLRSCTALIDDFEFLLPCSSQPPVGRPAGSVAHVGQHVPCLYRIGNHAA